MVDISTLPPRDKWVASGDSVARWRAQFDTIRVFALPDGGCTLSVVLAGVEQAWTLDAATRRHLAALLAG